ncbi:MAG: hypothetical protein LBB18_00255 [Puniceicoccales bacterium]|nr:hypothetical protein [Puniceicoccales bacterium]
MVEIGVGGGGASFQRSAAVGAGADAVKINPSEGSDWMRAANEVVCPSSTDVAGVIDGPYNTSIANRLATDLSSPTGVSRVISAAIHTLASCKDAGDAAEMFFCDAMIWKICAKLGKSDDGVQQTEFSIFVFDSKAKDGGQQVCTFTCAQESSCNDTEIAGHLVTSMGAIMHVAPRKEDLEKFSEVALEIRYPNGTLQTQLFPYRSADGVKANGKPDTDNQSSGETKKPVKKPDSSDNEVHDKESTNTANEEKFHLENDFEGKAADEKVDVADSTDPEKTEEGIDFDEKISDGKADAESVEKLANEVTPDEKAED